MSKMQTNPIVLLFVIAVFNGASRADDTTYSWMVSERGTMEIFSATTKIVDSLSTLEELKEAVKFNLFTTSNPEEAQQIYIDDDETLAASNFDASNPTRIIIHGWQSSSAAQSTSSIRDAYFSRGDYNVISVDWSTYASAFYTTACTKITTTGQYLGLMIDYLVSSGMNIEDLIVIGHSLGGHLAGVASRSATNEIPILIGLDPAGPLFYGVTTEAAMTNTDAKFVQVIHTNTGLLGYGANLGTIDLWPNGGSSQPGCTNDFFGACSHARAYYYFAESISNTDTQFVAYNCASYSEYTGETCTRELSSYLGGSSIDTEASGDYYLLTNSESPYAMG